MIVNHTTTLKVLFRISVLIEEKKIVHDPCPYGSNIFGTIEICPRYRQFEPLRVNHIRLDSEILLVTILIAFINQDL